LTNSVVAAGKEAGTAGLAGAAGTTAVVAAAFVRGLRVVIFGFSLKCLA